MKIYVIIYNKKWYLSRDDRSMGGWTKFKSRAWTYTRKRDAMQDFSKIKKDWKDRPKSQPKGRKFIDKLSLISILRD